MELSRGREKQTEKRRGENKENRGKRAGDVEFGAFSVSALTPRCVFKGQPGRKPAVIFSPVILEFRIRLVK